MKIKGVVDWWFETGCEGVCWAFYEDGKTGWDALILIKKGDRLTIYNKNGSVAFSGKIVPDYQVGWKKYPQNPKYGQPCALGFWIHWTQKGWKSDDWARLFMRKQGEPHLRAELIPGRNRKHPMA